MAQTNEEKRKKKAASGTSDLLERYLQRNMADRLQKVDEKILAQAIKTLLAKDINKKHLN